MKITTAFLFLFLILSSGELKAQAPDWLWQRSAGANSGIADGLKVALDSRSNVFVLGGYSKVLIFSSTKDTLHSKLPSDVFVAKYDNSGNLLWAKNLGKGIDATSLCIDRSDHILIGGVFKDSATFDSVTIYSKGQNDFFFSEYDEDGKLIWVKQAGGIRNEIYLTIAVDSVNNIYLAGACSDSALFDGSLVESKGSAEVGFIAKCDTIGKLIWIRAINSSSPAGSTGAFGVCIDRKGNVCIVGSYIDSIPAKESFLISKGNSDIFVAGYDSFGNLIFIKSAGGPGEDGGNFICVDKENNIYVAGTLDLTGGHEKMNFDNIQITSAGGTDFFVAKYNNIGEIQWAKRGGSDTESNGDSFGGICADNDSNIYFTGSIQIGNTSFGNSSFAQSGGVGDIFIAKINTQGDLAWSVSIGGENQDNGYGIAIDHLKNVYVTGSITQTLETDMFLGKYGTKSLSVILNPQSKKTISLFPNPSSSQATITYTLEKPGSATIEIYDLLGRLMKHISLGEMGVDEHSEMVDLSELRNGSYVCRITSGERVMNTSFIMMH